MNYAVITKNITDLRLIQSIIEDEDKTAYLYLECDISLALKNRRLTDTDILIVEAAAGGEQDLGALSEYIRKENRPEIIVLLNCCTESILRKLEGLSDIFLLNTPIEKASIEKKLREAVQKRKEHIRYEKLKDQEHLLENHRKLIQQEFWKKLISGQISRPPSDLMKEARDCSVDIRLEDIWHAAILSRKLIRERNTEIEKQSRKILLKAAEKWLKRNDVEYVLLDQVRPILLVKNILKEEFIYQCEEFIRSLEKNEGMPLCIFYDADIYCENLFSRIQYVIAAEKEDWVNKPGIYPAVVRFLGNEEEISMTLLGQMETLIQNGYYTAVLHMMNDFLLERAAKGKVSGNYLRALRTDMEQLIFSVLKEKSILAHKVLKEKSLKELWDNAYISVESFIAWLEAVFDHIPQSEPAFSQVEMIQNYVKEHIFESISREELARHFFINADYMGRQYKHKTGETLGQYITREKMKKAAEILSTTEKSIGETGVLLGFDNFAHFSKLFKKIMGCTPKEYRNQNMIKK